MKITKDYLITLIKEALNDEATHSDQSSSIESNLHPLEEEEEDGDNRRYKKRNKKRIKRTRK